MKDQIRKPSYSEIYMYKSIFWFAIGVFVFCPIVNNILLQLLYWYFSTDIAYSYLITPIAVLQETISLAGSYAGLAVLCISVLYFGKMAKGVTVLAFVSHAVTFFTYCIALVFWIGGISLEYIFEALLIVLPDAAVMLLLYIIIMLYPRKKQVFMRIEDYRFDSSMKKHPYTVGFSIFAGVFALVDIAVEAVGMLIYYLNPKHFYEIPDTFKEILDLVLQYVYILLFALVGFVIMILVGLMAQRLKDSGKQKYIKLKQQKS